VASDGARQNEGHPEAASKIRHHPLMVILMIAVRFPAVMFVFLRVHINRP